MRGTPSFPPVGCANVWLGVASKGPEVAPRGPTPRPRDAGGNVVASGAPRPHTAPDRLACRKSSNAEAREQPSLLRPVRLLPWSFPKINRPSYGPLPTSPSHRWGDSKVGCSPARLHTAELLDRPLQRAVWPGSRCCRITPRLAGVSDRQASRD